MDIKCVHLAQYTTKQIYYQYEINLFLGENMAIKSLSIRIDEDMLDKLHVVADYEGRSANGQINILIRDCIAAYEKEHGKIELGK